MATTSYWRDTASTPQFPALAQDLTVDAVVVGGGNTGIVAAYLMKQAGLKVALIERDRCAGVDTAHTSAHLTQVTDLRAVKLTSQLGHDHAQAVWDAGQAAIQQLEEIVRAESIECHFARVPGYLHASLVGDKDEREDLHAEEKASNELGYPATYVESVPVVKRPGVRFPNQARFHPVEFLGGLLPRIPGQGCHVFEHTEAKTFADDELAIEANGQKLRCRFIFIATDVPLQGKTNIASATLFQTKIAPYTSYVIGAKVAKGDVPDALYWDTADPYHFLRIEPRRDHDYVVFGGADHKTGQKSEPQGGFDQLARTLHRFLPKAEIEHRWSGQVIESVDGLPYIGETAPGQYVATGFSGNGLTFGTVGAMMACDAALGRKNPWQDVFQVTRKKLSALWNYLRENKDYPYYMVKDRLAKSEGESLSAVKRGQGKLLKIDGQRLAVYRDDDGMVTKLNPACTHMGCLVHFNDAESTWDCPCHGSRFRATGEVLAGPAETPMEAVTGD